jgi:hypothetical protein
MPKKNDNIVGRSEGPIVGGGHQTPEQAAIVQQGGGGLTDSERRESWSQGGEKGRGTPAIGGSSQGHSDQMAARGPDEDRKVAGGRYDTERTHSGDGPRAADRDEETP